MSLIDDVREIAASPPTYGHEVSGYVCASLVEHHEDCHYCDATLSGPNRERLGEHKPDCPWLAMPRIVAALEAAQALVEREVPGYWTAADCSVCGVFHTADCRWQALVAAMEGG